MAANRLFTVLVVLSLGLGIGANTAIYSFVDAILLRSLPVSDPESLVVLNWHAKGERVPVMRSMSGSTWGDSTSGTTAGMFPFPVFELFRTKDSVFASVFAHFQVLADKEPERHDPRTGGPCQRLERVGRLFSWAWHSRGRRTAHRRRRRQAWGAAGGGRQLRVQPETFRRPRERSRPVRFSSTTCRSRSWVWRRRLLRRRSRGGSRRLSPAAHARVHGRWQAVRLSAGRLPGRALLLDPDHGPFASRSHACSGAGRAGAGISAMGRQHRHERPRESEPACTGGQSKAHGGSTVCAASIPSRSTSCWHSLDSSSPWRAPTSHICCLRERRPDGAKWRCA